MFNCIWCFSFKVLNVVYTFIRQCKTEASEASEKAVVIHLHLKIPLEEYGANTMELDHLRMSCCESWL